MAVIEPSRSRTRAMPMRGLPPHRLSIISIISMDSMGSSISTYRRCQ
jgi:hypothetical protein